MARKVEPVVFGIDVSKAELSICSSTSSGVFTLPNQRAAIRRWLRSLTGEVRIAVEATNTFHRVLVDDAYARGCTVFVVDGYRLNRYRQSIGGRAKTDRTDAELLLRYLQNEGDDLHSWSPPPAGYLALQQLLRRRSTLVQAHVTLRQSLSDLPDLTDAVQALWDSLNQLEKHIRRQIAKLLRDSGVLAYAKRCQQVEGIGPLTAAALANAFQRGRFSCSDAFIAFLGLDVRVRESGTFRGRRKLTKQGDPHLRRLLYTAAMAACRHPTWKALYEKHRARGLASTQALVILARKLARIAFALMKNQTDYQPKSGCMRT